MKQSNISAHTSRCDQWDAREGEYSLCATNGEPEDENILCM
jgi:hypothetical protein